MDKVLGVTVKEAPTSLGRIAGEYVSVQARQVARRSFIQLNRIIPMFTIDIASLITIMIFKMIDTENYPVVNIWLSPV